MSKDHKNKNASFEEYKAYRENKMSAKEKHAFEKKMLRDEFESEALEGFEDFDIKLLDSDLRELSENVRRKSKSGAFPYLRIAAVIALFVSATIGIFYIVQEKQDSSTVGQELTPLPEDTAEKKNEKTITGQIPKVKKSDPYQKTGTDTVALHSTEEPSKANQDLLALNNRVSEEEVEEELSLPKSEEPVVAEKKDIELSGQSAVNEIQLEPLPETEELNRVATAEVLPSEDHNLKEEDVDIPSRIVYDEGMKEKPEQIESGARSIAQGTNFERLEKRSKKASNTEPAAMMYTDEKVDAISIEAVPTVGLENYINYLKNNFAFEIGSDSLIIFLQISAEGNIDQIILPDEFSDDKKSRLEEIIKSGPKWEPARENGIPVEQRATLTLKP